MKILLIHPGDSFSRWCPTQCWDLVVDLGRSPAATYEDWSRRTACPVISLYDHANEAEDLDCLGELLGLGVGRVVDNLGIDWWDVFSLEIASKIQQAIWVYRLSKELPINCDLYCTRRDVMATALQRLLDAKLTCPSDGMQSIHRHVLRYGEAFWRLGKTEFLQLIEDKFDADHSIRRRFAVHPGKIGEPVVLLPSAYGNVSRIALSYAAMLPEQQFMLVIARRNGYPASVPHNVVVTSLTQYFGPTDKHEIAGLLESWGKLHAWLVSRAAEFKIAEFDAFSGSASRLFRWGLALRNAWLRFYTLQQVTACLTADDSNPNTRLPLILARKFGIPALACHHGAFDFRMAIKVNHADVYLAKGEMEQDYLRRVCHVAPEKIVVAPPGSWPQSPQPLTRRSGRWLVFFSEPYQSYGWRSDEAYRDLLPHLCSLARACGMKLVFKLHPFESIESQRNMLQRLIPEDERQIEVLGGPPSDRLWNNTGIALTVQSSSAVECAALGIPVFLCAWLRAPYSRYVQQYARFGIGHVLKSPDQLAMIPLLVRSHYGNSMAQHATAAIDPIDFAHLLSGACHLPVASNA